jgi:hypothetical protein
MWTGSLCGADGVAADTIRYLKIRRDATISEYCRAYSTLVCCTEQHATTETNVGTS